MKLLLFLTALAVAGLPCAFQPSHASTNIIATEITNNAAWSGTNLVQGTVTIRAGATVTIAPGTKMLMASGATLLVRGQLLANGATNQMIQFTRQTASARWNRLQFIKAAPSQLRYCLFEFANSAGSHLDYYDNDCDPATAPPARNYHEAIVVLASHLDVEGCVFQNLPDDSGSGEGDAIAVISDDPTNPGQATAHIWNSRFLSIGQGIHTRFSHVLVEHNFFTNHHGDNDDIDMYGESQPPPLIRYNVFTNPNHDDMINPTRCSAIIVGNVISGGDDHGIVLRDKCRPIVLNNLIFNCASAGIAVQNQCDALIANNTILNCARGIRFFDHTTRWTSPYCLFPGSGRATIVNCLIWDCPTPLLLTDSPYVENRGSHVSVAFCNIEGGRPSASVSTNSTLAWGPGNISLDPLLTAERRLQPGSPCIDAGGNPLLVATNFTFQLVGDLDGHALPLDGNADGTNSFDIGADEFLLARADSNQDGIPDGWTHQFGFNLLDQTVAAGNPDQDAATTFQEWVADTDPLNPASFFRIATLASQPVQVEFSSSTNRLYTLMVATNLTRVVDWSILAGQTDVRGNGASLRLGDPNPAVGGNRFYRVRVRLP